MARRDEVWKSPSLVHAFLEGVRGGIPFAAAQLDVMLRLAAAAGRPVARFADLGCGDGVLAGAILERHKAAHGTLVDFSASPSAWVAAVADEQLIDSLHAFHAEQGSPKTREQVADEYVHRADKQANILAPVEEQTRWLREIGFVDVDCYFKVFELAVIGGRRPFP